MFKNCFSKQSLALKNFFLAQLANISASLSPSLEINENKLNLNIAYKNRYEVNIKEFSFIFYINLY